MQSSNCLVMSKIVFEGVGKKSMTLPFTFSWFRRTKHITISYEVLLYYCLRQGLLPFIFHFFCVPYVIYRWLYTHNDVKLKENHQSVTTSHSYYLHKSLHWCFTTAMSLNNQETARDICVKGKYVWGATYPLPTFASIYQLEISANV